ncbi:unnamed protein product [Bemisia tabaci]|uniref:Uncharacterized protein n=1 Tax=Bemisia tabaci TaxID=7038 RepID=A0A9N9ZYG6_BEMTA|nr:unnamed protein product [Bemisia tabaci]
MARQREWRKLVKKLRRKRIRASKARKRDLIQQKEQEEMKNLPSYKAWLSEKTALEIFQREEHERQRIDTHRKWQEAEEEAQAYWLENQKRIAQAKAEKFKQEIEFLAQMDAYINGSAPLPEGVAVSSETHPTEPECPFFSKVGACRFWDFCSRNHKRPGISKVLLIPGFFSHISLDQLNESNKNEYDTDVSLEYNEEEAYNHFLEFYDDVVKELKTYGELVQFKVCCNAEPHLRGNVYAQYTSKRAAMKAYQALQGRYYSGKQLKVEFTRIPSWKSAICGLFQGSRCPKGKNCNYLHVFWNPTAEFKNADKDLLPRERRKNLSPSPFRSRSNKHWRWSESPEPISISTESRKSCKDSHRGRDKHWKKSRKKDKAFHSKDFDRKKSQREREISNDSDSSVSDDHQRGAKLIKIKAKKRSKERETDWQYSHKSRSQEPVKRKEDSCRQEQTKKTVLRGREVPGSEDRKGTVVLKEASKSGDKDQELGDGSKINDGSDNFDT